MTNTGYNQSLYFGAETANKYGSAVTVNQAIGLVQSVNPTETNNLIKIRTMGGTRDFSNIVPGKFEVSGSIDYNLQGAAFLRMAMGEDTASTATIDSGPRIHTGASYLHVMGSAASPAADCFPSFTLEFADSAGLGCLGTSGYANNLKRTYNGCRVNSLTVSGSVDEPLSVSADWIAQSVTVSTAEATSVSDSTTDPYVFYQGQVYATSAAVTGYTAKSSGDEIAEVNSFDFSVNNNLEAVWYISGTTNSTQNIRGLKKLLAKARDYDASLNLHFANKTMYQRFLGSNSATSPAATLSSYTIVLDFLRSGAIGSTPKLVTDDYIRIVMADCKFNDINITGAPEDIVSQNIGVFVESAKIYVVDADATYK